jgi:hypothetical protein
MQQGAGFKSRLLSRRRIASMTPEASAFTLRERAT